MANDTQHVDNTGHPYVEEHVDENGNLIEGLRQDGLWDVPIELPLDVWGTLAIEAHNRDMTLNERLVEIILAAAIDVENFQMTPTDWLRHSSHFKGYTIVDPDGWDRANYEEDWARPITLAEMWEKTNRSAVLVDNTIATNPIGKTEGE